MFDHPRVSAWDTKTNAHINFLHVQLEITATYCHLAERADPAHVPHYLKISRRTYENVIRYMPCANLSGAEFSDITAKTERLKFKLEALEARHNGLWASNKKED